MRSATISRYILLCCIIVCIIGNINSHGLGHIPEFVVATTPASHQLQDMASLGSGKICYGYQAVPNPDQLVSFELTNPEVLTIIAPSISADKISGGTWINNVWWCCEYTPTNNSNIWTINHTTGEMTLLGASGSPESLHGLAYDDASDTLYACGTQNLYTINRQTGAASLIGSFGIPYGVMIGLACDGAGKVYGEDLHTDSLYAIDTATGDATLIGAFGMDLNYGQDLEIDKDTGICYLAAFTVDYGNDGALYVCNLSTAAVTKIGSFGSVTTQITGFAIPYTDNHAPDPPTIMGPTQGNVGENYSYTFSLVDPDDDMVYLRVDWGDGTPVTWQGPFDSFTNQTRYHTWNRKGTYIIKAQAKDQSGAESDWTQLSVTVPHHFLFIKSCVLWIREHFPRIYALFITNQWIHVDN